MIVFGVVFAIGILIILVSIFQNKMSYGHLLQKVDAFIDTNIPDNLQQAVVLLNTISNAQKLTQEVQSRYYRVYYHQENWYMSLYHLNNIQDNNLYTDSMDELEIYLLKAELYQKIKKRAQALACYVEALEKDENHVKANWACGELYYVMKNYAEALKCLEKAYSLNPDAPMPSLFILGDVYYHQKNYEQAYQLADIVYNNTANEVSTNSSANESDANRLAPQSLFLKIRAALQTDRYGELNNMLLILNEDHLYYKEATLVRGLMLFRGGDKKAAYDIFAETLPKYKQSNYNDFVLESRYEYASILMSDKKWQEALTQYQKIFRKGQIFRDVERMLDALVKLTSFTEIEKCRSYHSLHEWYKGYFNTILMKSAIYNIVKENFPEPHFAHFLLKPKKNMRLTNAQPFLRVVLDFTLDLNQQVLVNFLKKKLSNDTTYDKNERLCIYSLLYDSHLLKSIDISSKDAENIFFLKANQMQEFLNTTEINIS